MTGLSPRTVVLLLASAAALQCQSVGQKLVEGVHTRRDTLADALRPASRTFVAEAGRTFRDSVRPDLVNAAGEIADRLDSTIDRVSDKLEHRLRRIEDSLAWFVANPGKTALHDLLAPTLSQIRESIRSDIKQWIATLAESLNDQLPDVTTSLVDRATNQASIRLASSTDSTGPLSRSLVALTDRVVRQAVASIRDESSRKTPWWVWLGIAVLAALVVSAVGSFILKLRAAKRNHEQSLRAMAQAIKERNDPRLAERVKNLATEHGVEPVLHRFLDENRLLV